MAQGIDFDCAFNSALRARSEAAIFPASTYVPKHNTSTLTTPPLSAISAYVHDGNYESTRKLSAVGRQVGEHSQLSYIAIGKLEQEQELEQRAEATQDPRCL